MTPNPPPYPVYPVAGRCRHGRSGACPDFYCRLTMQEDRAAVLAPIAEQPLPNRA